MEFSKEIVINKSLEQVADLLRDPEHSRHWQPALLSITQTAGTPGTPGATATFDYDYKGRQFQLHETVVVIDLPRETVATYTTNGMVHTVTTRLSADGDTTRVEFVNAMEFSGMMKLMGSFLAVKLREQAEANIDYFKLWAETGEDVDWDTIA